MKPFPFIFGVHLHQPIGNFDHVLEDVYQLAYQPFLTRFAAWPDIKLVWHCSGYLLDWLDTHHPEYLDQVARLVQSGRLEVFGGGMYEPILPAIPARDRAEQLNRLADRLDRRFGLRPLGAWLAERVWEPGLVPDLARVGVRYVALDDAHFQAAGLDSTELAGYYTAEGLHEAVGVFPISERMRYVIPWAEIPRLEEEFATMAERQTPLAVMMDDAEKFGGWPDTYTWVYEKGWLDQFFHLLSRRSDLIRTTTFAEFWAEHPPAGRVALPAGSYMEMGQWALPPKMAARYRSAREQLEQDGRLAEWGPFLRGGIWPAFLTRYDEAHYLHRRGLDVGRAFDDPALSAEPAYDHLLRAQCNDAYWHGVFGGLYFPHLRHALWAELLRAHGGLSERAAATGRPLPTVRFTDLDLDRQPEAMLEGPDLIAVVAPARGGALLELSSKSLAVNFLATLARRPELYHLVNRTQGAVRLADKAEASAADSPPVFDRGPRWSCRERVYAAPVEADVLMANTDSPLVDLTGLHLTPIIPDPTQGSGLAMSGRDGTIQLVKAYRLSQDPSSLEVGWELTGAPPTSAWFGVEWTLGLAGGEDPRLGWTTDGGARRPLTTAAGQGEVTGLTICNDREGYRLRFTISRPVAVRLWPVETTALAIDRLERTFQGLGIALLAPLSQGQVELAVSLRIEVIG